MHRTLRLSALLLLAAVPAGAQQRIEVGQAAEGRLAAGDQADIGGKLRDMWEFAAREGVAYRITLRSEDFDAWLMVGPVDGEACEICETDDDGGGGSDAQLVVVAEASGPWSIEATTYESGESGRYTLRVEETEAPPPDPDAPPPLANSGGGRLLPGVAQSGVLTEGDAQSEGRPPEEDAYYDVWTYRGSAGEPLAILMSSDSFDTFLRMGRRLDGRWEELAANDDAGGIGDSKIAVTLPADGEYEVHAGAYREHETGIYIIAAASGFGAGTVVTATTDPGVELPILAPGGSKDAELAAGDAVGEEGAFYDAYRYFASAGETATFELASEEFDAVLRIGVRQGGAWREVARDDDGGSGMNSDLTFTFPARGEYEIRAGTFAAGGTGPYSLFAATDIHADIEASLPDTTIVAGQTRRGRLEPSDPLGDNGAFVDAWSTIGGGSATIDLRSRDFDPLLRVFAQREDGTWEEVASNDDGGVATDSRLTIDLPAGRNYRIHVTAYRAGDRGEYRRSVRF